MTDPTLLKSGRKPGLVPFMKPGVTGPTVNFPYPRENRA